MVAKKAEQRRPSKNAQYPIEAITLTRGAAIAGSSAPALIPTGNPKARPTPTAPHRCTR